MTYLYEDDISEPLTPAHLLSGRNLSSSPEASSLIDWDARALTRRFQYLRTTLRALWCKFQHHYLTELREHHMNTNRKTNSDNKLKVGDVVIIMDDGVRQRTAWRLGRVVSLIVGRDGHVRGAMLKTVSQLNRPTTMKRPIQKLIALEVAE